MLRSMKDMEYYTIGATDGIIGRVRDFYFDDEGETGASRSSVVGIMLSYKIERCDRPARR
jgi:hypothetical protein